MCVTASRACDDTLEYARRLREAGFSERQANGQAEALAAAMTDSLASKQDLRELEGRLDLRFAGIDAKFEHIDRQMETRITELEKRFELRLVDLEHRVTLRLGGITVAGIGVVSTLVKLL